MKFKYYIIVMMALLLMILTSCNTVYTADDGNFSVVCTAFPQYDWVRHIADGSDKLDVTYLADNGTDMHSYQPSAEDIIKIADCDVLISVGGTSEKWIDDAAVNNPKSGRIHLRLTDILGNDVMTIHDGHPVDEHVWLSLRNAIKFCGSICEALSKVDEENAELYRINTKKYTDDLDYVDRVAAEFIASAPRDTIVVADRFPLRYTLRDYGIKYHAAFEGCSSDSEVTFETVIHLSETVDLMNIGAVITMDDSDGKIAEAVISNAKNEDIEIYKLNSMQSVSAEDIKNGIDYISVMRDNLALIHGALII